MGTVFDLLLIATMIIFVLVNYFRGIFKMLKSFKFLAAFLIALEYKESPGIKVFISKFINFDEFRLHLRQRLDSMWGETLDQVASEPASGRSFDGIFGGIANKITNITEYCQKALADGAEDFTATVLDQATLAAESFFIQLVGFIVVFCLAFLSISIICLILTFILNHGILKHINRILGAIAGLVFGFVVAWIASILIVNFAPMLLSGDPDSITNGFFGVVRWFYNDCALSKIFGVIPLK